MERLSVEENRLLFDYTKDGVINYYSLFCDIYDSEKPEIVKMIFNIVKYMVKRGVDDHEDIHKSRLSVFCGHGDIDIVRFLVEQGDKIHEEYLREACKWGNNDVIAYFLDKGIQTHSCIKYAMKYDDLNLLKTLVDHGFEIDDYDITSIPKYAPSLPLIKFLLENTKFDPEILNIYISSALSFSYEKRHMSIFSFLLSYKADVNKDNGYMLKQMIKNESLEFLNLSIENGANLKLLSFDEIEKLIIMLNRELKVFRIDIM